MSQVPTFFYQLCLQLAYLPYRRRDLILDEENIDLYVNLEGNAAIADDSLKEEKKTKKHGLLNWLKLRVSCPLLFAIANAQDYNNMIEMYVIFQAVWLASINEV